ncbi:Uncharacterised protein [Mycobacteroides abscessus subsp. massiliense]|uniref:hypothetical protein n=1 Tax=Mycobacteroides abscessus TaxID=36809 RepID=UPI0009A7AEF9|nr:hypothetical protein [Mycobacteroides abscessus]SKU72177.1 Uncharacterised protein [Mycobacteroides abscessus subsp. massiliense]SKV04293.1 Uncharacterised protein [Mycobacteroides abscessus subsp. massiliense]
MTKAKAAKASQSNETDIDDEIERLDNDGDIEGAIDELKAPEVPPSNEGIEPGSPEFDWQLEYPGEPVFVFTSSTGVTVGMAALAGARKPGMGVLRLLRKSNYLDQMWTTLEWVSSPAALTVSDEFSEEDYSAMFAAWAEWSKTSAGESSR